LHNCAVNTVVYVLESVASFEKTHYTRPRLSVGKLSGDVLCSKEKAVRKEKIAMKRFLLWQGIVTLGLTVIVRLLWDQTAAWSTFFGGLLAVVPNVFFVTYFLMRVDPRHPKQVASACYVGEALKIMLTALLLVLLLRFESVALAPLLIGLMGTYAVYMIAPLFLGS